MHAVMRSQLLQHQSCHSAGCIAARKEAHEAVTDTWCGGLVVFQTDARFDGGVAASLKPCSNFKNFT